MHDVKLDRIEMKIDKLSERLNSVDVTLAAQHVSLDEHKRRSIANETAVSQLMKESASVKFAAKTLMWIVSSGILAVLVKAAVHYADM